MLEVNIAVNDYCFVNEITMQVSVVDRRLNSKIQKYVDILNGNQLGCREPNNGSSIIYYSVWFDESTSVPVLWHSNGDAKDQINAFLSIFSSVAKMNKDEVISLMKN